ncbi:MAG: rRNA maturation RNase YbeY [Phycisphaerae bacterium]
MKPYRISIKKFVRLLPLGEKKILRLAALILKGEKIPHAEISIAIVGDKRMADYAEKYARRRYRTDVFAFDLSDTGSELIGQIIANSQLAREQARKLKTNPAAELALYITHGLLHLTHYDDHTKKNAQKMHHRTEKYLRQTGFKKIPPLPA